MAKNFPCPRCCKHVAVTDDMLASGGIAVCRKCGYQIKFNASSKTQGAAAESKENQGVSEVNL